MHQRETLRELAVAAAAAAGALVAEAHARPGTLTAEIKSPGDYVTEVDRAAEQAAIRVLRDRAPDIPILAEESGGARHERMWVIDPLDGTTNFLRGFPVVGVSVALVEEGRPVVGAVIAPLLGEAWSAAEGQGAVDAEGRRLSVSTHPGSGVAATGFPFRRKDRLARYLPVMSAALQRFEDLRRAGAASLDLAYVGAGVFDGFFELGLGLWDIAAGALLVREAGGVVTDWAGDPDAVFVSGDILAGTPAWHAAMLEIVAA
ncbi:MAG: inositol monophosphatase family protein [Candidatus Dormiibacterota bacterium]